MMGLAGSLYFPCSTNKGLVLGARDLVIFGWMDLGTAASHSRTSVRESLNAPHSVLTSASLSVMASYECDAPQSVKSSVLNLW